MAITSEIIGKLGGASVDVTPVSATASGANGSEVVMHTVNVPSGETWLVAAVGDVTAANNNGSFRPSLLIGSNLEAANVQTGRFGMSNIATGGTVTVKLKRNYGIGSDSFTGQVYTVKI